MNWQITRHPDYRSDYALEHYWPTERKWTFQVSESHPKRTFRLETVAGMSLADSVPADGKILSADGFRDRGELEDARDRFRFFEGVSARGWFTLAEARHHVAEVSGLPVRLGNGELVETPTMSPTTQDPGKAADPADHRDPPAEAAQRRLDDLSRRDSSEPPGVGL